MNYSDKIPFDDLHIQIFQAIVSAMTGRGRGDALDKCDGNLECLKKNWEGFHLFEYVGAIRLEQDEKGENRLDVLLDKNGIRGFDGLRKLAHEQKSAFSNSKRKQKAKMVFESLAEFQDIPALVCFSKFLEFCKKSYRPLDVFDGKNQIEITVDGRKTVVTIDYAIGHIKRHIDAWEKSHKPPQPHLTIPEAKEHNDNYYANAVLEVIGRDTQKERLKAFLTNDDLKVAWFQLAGVAGQGKSRLAFDLIHETPEDENWRAGFLKENDIKSFKDHWKDWQPDKPYLLIFDYVVGREHEIKPILQTLVSNQGKYHHKIRILLVERLRWDQGGTIKQQDQNNKDKDELNLPVHFGNKAQWYLNLCADSYSGDSDLPCRFENGVEELEKLKGDKLVAIVKQLFSGKEFAISDDELKKTCNYSAKK